MKQCKKFLSILLCIVTVITCMTVGASAKASTSNGQWVTVKGMFVENYEEAVKENLVTYYLNCDKGNYRNYKDPYGKCNSVEIWVPDGQSIYKCFTLGFYDNETHDIAYEYLNELVYDKEDNCYYAQYKPIYPSFKSYIDMYGPADSYYIWALPVYFIIVLFIPFGMLVERIVMKLDQKINSKCFESYNSSIH